MQILKNTTEGLLALILVFFLWPHASAAQESGNPFELSPRLSLPDVEEDSAAAVAGTGNPFDLVAPAKKAAAPAPAVKPPPAAKKRPAPPPPFQNRYRTFLLIVNLGILLMLTILITLLRSQAGKAYRAFFNDNLLNQLQREREAGGGLPYYLFYGFFMINAGFFAFLLARHYSLDILPANWMGLLYCIAGVAGLFLGKQLLLGFLAFVFPIQKEVALYSFTIIVFSIMLGFFFVVVNLLLAYAPEYAVQPILYGAYAGIGATYLFRSLRGLFIGNRFALFHKFHFLLYICTVEIAPVLVLAKLLVYS
ncbi:MAG: DUF4271 domain-containing protein [Lewinellaceae bacterium]|nr:DUF4271 domain-containing protein [Phaeodactylibacter sp.]MCB9038213.1 DUF4271 domain-containing protein [Lewinellaceae bacterium]